MLSRRTVSMLSLARRAGKLISGEDTVLMAIRDGICSLVIIAGDAADNTVSKITSRAKTAGVDVVRASSREELSQATGLYNRTVFAVTDKSFADGIKGELNNSTE
jgi:ribosomal protein L7Ae-like RNA K-turn-binding protein